ncbi:hypothetical protein C7974DRAFT_384928 [Boeremia exigua]|uniref:uncharacterized protein n=1 Tax=Boeremia exigua TaxID=749465 RepID=UPI001E8DA381|nr:uncharacterized protein C7974DRAFT_384928 [Boeremia exigua]KAH6642150.1 hypothetical protein C7974DRAFT_384928 [Boeremia exigua]
MFRTLSFAFTSCRSIHLGNLLSQAPGFTSAWPTELLCLKSTPNGRPSFPSFLQHSHYNCNLTLLNSHLAIFLSPSIGLTKPRHSTNATPHALSTREYGTQL